MSSSTMRYPNDELLQERFVANQIEEYLQGELLAEMESTVRDLGNAESVSWLEEKYSDYGDPLRPAGLDALIKEDASKFKHVRFSTFEVKSAVTKTYGIEMDFSEEVRRNTQMVDMIDRGLKRGSYYLAFLLNELVFNNMTNSWSTTASTEDNVEPWNMAATAVWSDSSARKPAKDVRELKLMVEDTDNYANELDRAYLRKDNYEELLDYLEQTQNVTWSKDPTTNAWNGMFKGIGFKGVHKLAGIPANTGLFLSRGVKPTTIYERTDENYAQQRLVDNNGKQLPGAYHIHKYFTDEDHVTHIQIWREMVPVTTRWGRKSVGILRTL